MARPVRILPEPSEGGGIALGHACSLAGRRSEAARRIAPLQAGREETGTDLILERQRSALPGAGQGDRASPRGEQGAGPVAGGQEHGAAPDMRTGNLDGGVAEIESGEGLAAPLPREEGR